MSDEPGAKQIQRPRCWRCAWTDQVDEGWVGDMRYAPYILGKAQELENGLRWVKWSFSRKCKQNHHFMSGLRQFGHTDVPPIPACDWGIPICAANKVVARGTCIHADRNTRGPSDSITDNPTAGLTYNDPSSAKDCTHSCRSLLICDCRSWFLHPLVLCCIDMGHGTARSGFTW